MLLIISVVSADLGTHTQPAGFSLNFLRPALSVAHELGATGEKGNHHGKWGDKETAHWAPSLLLTEPPINITGFIWRVRGLPYHGFVIFLLLHCLTFRFPSEQVGAGYSACPRWVTPSDKPDWLQNSSYSASSVKRWDRKKQTANEETLLPNSSPHHIKPCYFMCEVTCCFELTSADHKTKMML